MPLEIFLRFRRQLINKLEYNFISIVGIIAGTLTTVAFIPQVYKVYKTKATRDISLGMFLIFSIGVGFWLYYGVLKNDYPIILANSITITFSLYILFNKIKFK